MMKTGCTGTERPKNGTGGLRRVVLALAVLLLTCVLMAGAVSADGENVAKIGDTEYATLQWAVDNVTDGTEKTIILLRNAEGNGVKVQSGKKIIFDLNGFTYNINGETVGSTGTETNGFQLLKGSEITFKNGTITSTKAKLLIQNYCNLTLEDVILDGTNLVGTGPYTLSNNCGYTVLKGDTKIIAKSGGVAFDVCYAPNNGYPEGVSVTIASDTVVISGPVEYGIWGTSDQSRAEKAIFNVPYGYDVDLTVSSPVESGGYYYWKATSDNQMVFTLKDDSPIKVLQDNAVVSADSSTVTLLRDTTLDEPIRIETPITFDGDGKTITAEGNTLTVVAGIPGQVTIKNVDATISTSTTNPNLDSPINIMSPVVMENNQFDITGFNNGAGDTVAVILTDGAKGSTLRETQITMGSADNTGVQGIAVYGNEVTISGSTITTTALQNDDKSTGIYTVGVGDITITDNTFVSEAENGAGNRGIMVYNPTADEGQSITITDNTFDLAAGAGDTAGAVVAVSSDDGSKNTVNLDVTKNTVTAAARGVYLVSDVTVTGDVAGNDFRAIPEESRIATAEGVEPNVDNLHRGNNDAPVDPQPVSGSSSGNMNNAYRVLFNDGATTLSVVTDLSSGDKLTKPETPVKDGYTFAGWYKDSACTQAWDFETGIPGDMTLYAKWTAAGSSGETEATATPTKTQTAVTTPQPTKTQSTTATTSAPEATTAAGVSPTLTQAPAPVAGALFGLLAAGVLLRRRFQ